MPFPGPPGDVEVLVAAPAQQDARDLDRAWAVLDAGERASAERLQHHDDRRAYVVAHALLRCVLAGRAGNGALAPALRFTRTTHGRPELVADAGAAFGGRRLSFNLSHTRDLVGCALLDGVDLAAAHGPVAAGAFEVGFDLEALRTPAPLEVATRFFSSEEVRWLHAQPPARRHRSFYALWTLKEACLKACGLGLSLPLDSFTVEPLPRGRARLTVQATGLASWSLPAGGEVPAGDPTVWTLRWWRVGGSLAAVAVRASTPVGGLRLRSALRISALAPSVDQEP